MAYTKTTWRNNQSPAINADNLNHIEQGVYEAHQDIAENTQNIENLTTQTGANTSAIALEKTQRQQADTAETLARENADNLLSARMDTFTQLPSGSTSGDAELIDIRVGADGVTYPTAGDAVRGQVSDLKSALNTYFDADVTESSASVSQNNKYVLHSNASVSSGNGWGISTPIQLSKGDIVIANFASHPVAEAIALTDSLGTSYSNAVRGAGDGDTVSRYVYKAEKDCYVAFSYTTANGCTYSLVSSNVLADVLTNDDFRIDATKYFDFASTVNEKPSIYQADKYIGTRSMVMSSANGYSLSNAINVKKGDLIEITCNGVWDRVEIIAYCNNDMTHFTRGLTSDNYDGLKTYSWIAHKDGKVCFSYHTSEGCVYSHYSAEIKSGDSYTAYKGKEISLFNKILCIGDSLTSGVFNHNEGGTMEYITIPEYSYPTYLKKLSGVDTTRLGTGGATTAMWYEEHQNDDVSGHDACIIQLGVNDISRQGSWDSTSDTALTNIINMVKAQNKNIKIYVATILPCFTGTKYSNANYSIRMLVMNLNDPNVQVVDIAEYGNVIDTPYYLQGHLTALGYRRLAEDYCNYISYLISNNLTAYKDVQFIGTDYEYNA